MYSSLHPRGVSSLLDQFDRYVVVLSYWSYSLHLLFQLFGESILICLLVVKAPLEEYCV